jgi:hypothetical protein
MTEELKIPGWVNSAYHGYHARRLKYLEWEEEAALEEEMDERLATPVELSVIHATDPLGIEENTRQMRREDWVDRPGRLAALGPALVSLVVIMGFCLIAFAVVWYGAAWLEYLTQVRL